jgi:uncharacterized damage-inducible protein DinB
MDDKALRKYLLELLEGKSAHIELKKAVDGFPLDEINTQVDSSPHTAWQLLEHIRIAQWDILEFSRNADHESPVWPEGYWPKADGTADKWRESARQVLADLQALQELAHDDSVDLFAPIPHGDGQTLLREILLVADHNAYHLGQLMLVRRMLEHK